MDKQAAADRRLLRPVALPLHWPQARPGARVLHVLGPSRRRVVEQDLRADLAGRAVLAWPEFQADITPNLDQVAPQANEFMKQ